MYNNMYSKKDKKKIMVVDDSPVMLRSIKSILDRNYTVYLATSGKQALHAIEEKEPDLLLLDYKMPEMDGIAVMEALQAEGIMYLHVIRFVKALFIRLSEFFGVSVFKI